MSEHTPLTESERIERVLQIELNRCWTCHKPRVSEGDWDRYVHPGEGEHLCWEVTSYTCTYPCDVPLETHIAEALLAARTSTATADEDVVLPRPEPKSSRRFTATADDGLRERVEALADECEREGKWLVRWYSPDSCISENAAMRLRAILDATAAPTTDTGARDE